MKKASRNTERIELSYHSLSVCFDTCSERATENGAEKEGERVSEYVCWLRAYCVFKRVFVGLCADVRFSWGLLKVSYRALFNQTISCLTACFRVTYTDCIVVAADFAATLFFSPSERNINRTLWWMIIWVCFFFVCLSSIFVSEWMHFAESWFCYLKLCFRYNSFESLTVLTVEKRF